MKVFEKLVHQQLYSHIDQHKLLNDFQSGFRPGHSTNTALIDVTDYLYNNMANQKLTGAIFLDLRKAFDTVDTEMLLHKLKAIGVNDMSFEWFQSYLTGRTQCVSLQGCISNPMSIEYGVPQGSILGPLLFTLYINDLPTVIKDCKVVLYADDTALFASGNDISQIQKTLNDDLARAHQWLNANKLTLNAKKTKSMLFGTSKKLGQVTQSMHVKVGDAELEQVEQFKYLGLNFDPCLNWTQHVKTVSSKIAQRIGVLYRARKHITAGTANTLCKTLIFPIIDYGNMFWSQGPQANNTRLQRLQNRAGRIVLRCHRRSHICDIHSRLQWTYCNTRWNLNTCLMAGKCILGETPKYLDSMFTFVHTRHEHRTRSSDTKCVNIPLTLNNSAQKTFAYRGAVLWNNLPAKIRQSGDFITFKRKCKDHF